MSKQKKEDIRQFIVLRAGKRAEIVDINMDDFNHEVYRILNVEIYEHVFLGICLDVGLHMLVDEAGAIKDPLPPYNHHATLLYGHNIYGDALLCAVDDNYNFGPIEGSSFFKICQFFGAT
jgi:hypothetical protein